MYVSEWQRRIDARERALERLLQQTRIPSLGGSTHHDDERLLRVRPETGRGLRYGNVELGTRRRAERHVMHVPRDADDRGPAALLRTVGHAAQPLAHHVANRQAGPERVR